MKMRFLVVVGALLVAAAIVAVVLYSRSEQSSSRHPASAVSAQDRIKVEIRAMPVATITVDGKNVGKTPMSLQYPRSDREITIEATLVRHLIKRDAKKDKIYKGVRKVPLTQDHLLDFTFENTELVDTKHEVIERAPPAP